MTAMVSVVSGGSIVQAQPLAGMKNGMAVRISAVKGARYVLAEVGGGIAAGDISVKRVGKNLLIEQELAGAETASVIIEDFYGSEGQLVGLGADGEYQEYRVASEHGAGDAAAMHDGASSLLSLGGQPAVAFEFAEGGTSMLNGALASLAAVAGGFALNNSKGSAGGNAKPTPAAASFMLEEQAASAADVQIAEPVQDETTVDSGVASEAASAEADAEADIENVVVAPNETLVPEASAIEEASVDPELAPEAGDSKGRVRPNSPLTDGAVKAAGSVVVLAEDFVPVIEQVMDDHGVIKGVIENGGYTDDVYPTIMGKAEPGVKVHVYRGKYLQGYAITDANGDWAFTPSSAYASGTHSITVKYEFPNGDTSSYSQPYVITVDKIAPGIPQITGIMDDEGRITGAISDQTITDDNRPTINGTGEPHAKLIIYDKGKEIGSTTVAADGTWTFTPATPLADGLHMLSYSAVDRAGNSGQQSDVTEFIVDTRPEKINIYYAEDDVGSLTDEVFSGGTTDDSTPTLFGTATAGGIVKIYEGSALLGEVTADVDGTWQFTPLTALSEGAHSFHATVTLPAKGESAPSRPFKLEVDFTAPSVPTIEQVLDDVGLVQGVVANGQSTDDATPTLSGKAEVGSTVHIYDNGKLLGTALVDATGEWSYTPSLSLVDGKHVFTISATDAAGNTTDSAVQHEISIDSVAPQVPTIASVHDDVGAVQGPLQQGGRTDDTQPSFTGNAEANSTVIIRDNGLEIGRVQANGQGEWTYTPASALASGVHEITVISLDQAGNASAPSDVFGLIISLLAQTGPSIVSIYDDVGPTTGELGSGAITDDDFPRINGKGDPYTSIMLIDNGVEIGRTQVDAAGSWSFQPVTPLSQGLHNLVATEVEAHGNLGKSSNSFGFRVVDPVGFGGFGGMENFNGLSLGYPAISTQSLVLASGVELSGMFGVSTVLDASETTGVRPEDAREYLYLGESDRLRMQLPVESKKVSFGFEVYSADASVSIFDTNGELIAKLKLKARSQSTTPRYDAFFFQAPEGKLIASLEISDSGKNTSVLKIDALQWGSRYPTDISISTAESDGFGGRIVYGSVTDMPYLLPDMVVQVSTDGGRTWTDAAFSEGSWAVVQTGMPPGDWTAEVRIVERSTGLSIGLSDSKFVDTFIPGAPVIERIADAEGMYTSSKAADGSLIEVSLEGAGAQQGDHVHVRWGTVTYDQLLTKADIASGHVVLKMPADQIMSQGVTNDFSVTVQIIGKNGAIGVKSQPYDVTGTYAVGVALSDKLQSGPVGNLYKGSGFQISTEGVMAKTALTSSTYSGLTLSDASQKANALFTLDKPAREVSLRLSGIDSEQGVKIQLFDTKGNMIEEKSVFGDATAFHASSFSYTPADERVDIGSFKIIASEANVTLDAFSRKNVVHNADTRNPYEISSSKESFFGGGANDVVTLHISGRYYFDGLNQGIHGGDGIDTLMFRGGGPYDGFSFPNMNVSSIEIFDLGMNRAGNQKSLDGPVLDFV